MSLVRLTVPEKFSTVSETS